MLEQLIFGVVMSVFSIMPKVDGTIEQLLEKYLSSQWIRWTSKRPFPNDSRGGRARSGRCQMDSWKTTPLGKFGVAQCKQGVRQ